MCSWNMQHGAGPAKLPAPNLSSRQSLWHLRCTWTGLSSYEIYALRPLKVISRGLSEMYMRTFMRKSTSIRLTISSHPHSSPTVPGTPCSPSHWRLLITALSSSRSACKLATFACSSAIFASFAFKANREMSLPLTTP